MYGYEVFHEKLMEGMISNIRKGNVPHAYIFEGEKGLGKFEAAKLFAEALCCINENQPCGICNSCRGAKTDNNPDIIFVKPEDKHKTIGVDVIRELVADAYIKPFLAKRKVYIFEDADILTPQSQNAFLKLLEEPPEYAVFIIITQNARNLLQTIQSRCITIRFPSCSDTKIYEYIKKINPECKDIDFLVKYARGNPGSVKDFCLDEKVLNIRKEAIQKIDIFFSHNKQDAYKIAEYVESNKDNARFILSLWKDFIRDIILTKHGLIKFAINADFKEKLNEYAAITNEEKLVLALSSILKAEQMIAKYVSLHAAMLWLGISLIG